MKAIKILTKGGRGNKDPGGNEIMSDYKKTVAVDLDGVLAKYTGFKGDDIIEEPRPEARHLLHRLSEKYHVIVHTARNTETARIWLIKHNLLRFTSGINACLVKGAASAKPIALTYIDDRAVHYSGDVEVTLALVNQMAEKNFLKDTQGLVAGPPQARCRRRGG